MFGNLQDVTFSVSLEPCYALNSKAKSFTKADLSFAGMVLMDTYRNFSIRVERSHFKFISNEQLILKAKQLIGGSKIAWRIIYYNNDKTEFYLNGIITEWKGLVNSKNTLFKPALELSNFYTGRYNSRILFSIYNPVNDTFIRTPLTLHTEDTVSSFSQELHNNLTQTYLPNFLDNKFVNDSIKFSNIVIKNTTQSYIPYRIKQMIPKVIKEVQEYYNDDSFPITEYQLVLLIIVAKLAHEWTSTNYENARKFQHYYFERIMKEIPLLALNSEEYYVTL